MRKPLLSVAFPDFAGELRAALTADGLAALAEQVDELRIHALCGCGDSFCTSFYTGPRPDGPWGPGHENVVPDIKTGMVVLDVVDGEIRYIEILDRGEMRPAFRRFPRQHQADP